MITAAVFCGSAREVDARYLRHAFSIGEILASRGHSLVCGGNRGMAKQLLDGFLSTATTAKAVSVVASQPATSAEGADARSVTFVYESLGARKEAMLKMSQLAIVLPGGLGTLDEFFHLLAMRSIKNTVPPVVVCDYWCDFADLFAYFGQVVARKFARSEAFECDVVRSDEELIDLLARHEPVA
jgi:uncharacterized protein (TIGR00730 family)